MDLERLLRVPRSVERLLLGQTSEMSELRLYWRRHPIEKFAYSPVGMLTAAVILAAAIAYNRTVYQPDTKHVVSEAMFELEHDAAVLADAPRRHTTYQKDWGHIPDK